MNRISLIFSEPCVHVRERVSHSLVWLSQSHLIICGTIRVSVLWKCQSCVTVSESYDYTMNNTQSQNLSTLKWSRVNLTVLSKRLWHGHVSTLLLCDTNIWQYTVSVLSWSSQTLFTSESCDYTITSQYPVSVLLHSPYRSVTVHSHDSHMLFSNTYSFYLNLFSPQSHVTIPLLHIPFQYSDI